MGFSGGSDGKESACSAGDPGSIPGKTPWRRKWQSTPVFLPGKSHDGGAWQTTVHGVAKRLIQLSDSIFFLSFSVITLLDLLMRSWNGSVLSVGKLL